MRDLSASLSFAMTVWPVLLMAAAWAGAGEARKMTNIVADWPASHAACRPVPMGAVTVAGFLGDRCDRNKAALLAAMRGPLPRGFEARAAGKEPPPETNRLAADSDLYKWLEGACYFVARTRDAEVRQHVDRMADLIVRCQHDDGYINTQVPPRKRFDPRVNHDLYIAGHFFEAAVAHHRSTRQRSLLDAARRWADYILAQHRDGHAYFKTVGAREHSEYELGFLRLARETGKREYVDLAIALAKTNQVGPRVADVRAGGGLHAVRVGYLLAGLADLYLETGRADLYEHLPGLWDELVGTRMYVTGAIGSHGESISKQPYDLPHTRDHPHRQMGETCASIAMALFSWRMHAATAESRRFDIIERILYNHFLGALSLDHLGHFYYNPMRVVGDLRGHTDHGHSPCTARCRLPKLNRTACCMPNVFRFLGALPEYLFSADAQGLFVNLYSASAVRHALPDGRQVALDMETDYPHDGRITIRVAGDRPARYLLRLRIPGWCAMATVEEPGKPAARVGGGDYLVLDRTWTPGETLTLTLPMPVRLIPPHPRVAANASQVVFARGPLVYCLEFEDVPFPVEQARVSLRPDEAAGQIGVEWRADLLDGIHVLRFPGWVEPPNGARRKDVLPLIPWYARANRSDESRWILFLPWRPFVP